MFECKIHATHHGVMYDSRALTCVPFAAFLLVLLFVLRPNIYQSEVGCGGLGFGYGGSQDSFLS